MTAPSRIRGPAGEHQGSHRRRRRGPRRRRSVGDRSGPHRHQGGPGLGHGVTVYLDAQLPPVDADAGAFDRAGQASRCDRGRLRPIRATRRGPALCPPSTNMGVHYARWRPACLRAEQRQRRAARWPRPSLGFGSAVRATLPACDQTIYDPLSALTVRLPVLSPGRRLEIEHLHSPAKPIKRNRG